MTTWRCPCALAIALVVGCFKPSDDAGDEIGGTTDTTGDTTDDDTTTTTTTDTTDDTTDTTTGDEEAFVFATDPPENYNRVDRMGMPAVATTVITSKNDYNAANPTDDDMGQFLAEMAGNLAGLHMALDDDLLALMLVPCSADVCFAQAGPLAIPDTLKLDLTAPPGFPNGRRLGDPVVDIALAVLMLDLSVMGQTASTFADVPVNPPANDVGFSPLFPYLAPPN
jgi:hypothetical protein